jgi:hypothetical protein
MHERTNMTRSPSTPYGEAPHALGYGQFGYPPPGPRRPTSVTVIAIFTIIFGVIGLLGVAFQFLQFLVPQAMQFGGPNPVNDLMRTDPVIATWMGVMAGAGGILALMELIGGVGALSLKPWARKALLFYATGAIVAGLAGTVFNVVVMIPKLSQIPQNRPEVKMTIQLMPIMTIGGFLIGLILPVCVLIFMTRPKVKAAFAGQAPPGDAYQPAGSYPPAGYPPAAPG